MSYKTDRFSLPLANTIKERASLKDKKYKVNMGEMNLYVVRWYTTSKRR